MRIAVVGAGVMGANHIRVLSELGGDVDLVGIADPDPVARAAVARRFATSAYEQPAALFDETAPDAVVVAVPTSLHHDIARDAIDRGISVLVEKPLAETLEQACELVAAAERAGVTLAVGHIERFNPAVRELERRLGDGELGRIFMLHSRRQSPFPGRIRDVGVIADLATHEVDMMRHLAGAEVAGIQSTISQVLHPSQEDIVFGLLHFENGVLGVLDVNWVTPTKVRDISVTGERGMFTVDYLRQELYFHANAAVAGPATDRSKWTPGSYAGVHEGDMTRFHISRREPLREELLDFLDAVRTGRPPAVGGADGVRAIALTDQIRRVAVRAQVRP